MKYLIAILILIIPSTGAMAQYRYPNKENQALAKQLKSKYDEDDALCALHSTENYTFDLDRSAKNGTPQVIAQLQEENELISLKDNCSRSFPVFYDSFSKVYRFRVWYKGDKNYKQDESYNDNSIGDLTYSSNGIFYDDAKYKNFGYSFDGLGDLMKYSYIKSYSDVKYLTHVFFNESYPIDDKVVTFEVPDWLVVDLVEFNFEGFNITKTVDKDASKKMTKYTYTMHNCNSIKQDNNAPIATRNWPHLVVVVKQFEDKGKKYNAFNSVDDLYAWYAKLVSNVKNKESDLQPLVTKLTQGKTNDLDKIKSMYYWVQDNIRYIAFEDGLAGFQPASADQVYKNKFGDCKGMANLLYAMLKMSGYDARLTWIGTKDIPYDYSLPSLCVNNHMICALMLKDSLYFLDGTETYIAFGDYADRIQGRPALIQDGKSYMIKNVPSFPKERNKVICKRTVQLNEETLKGATDVTYNGESKTNILRVYNDLEKNNREDALTLFLSKNDKNCSVSNIKTTDLENREIPLNFKYNFELNNSITTADKEVYVTLEMDKPYAGISVKEDRKQDFIFHEKVLNTAETEFSVPAGYTIKYIPETTKISNKDFSFSSEYTKQGNKITYKRTIAFENGVVDKKEMKEFSAFVKKVKSAYSDQIILEKK